MMNRRLFLQSALTLGASAALARENRLFASQPSKRARTFKLHYAPHFGMFRQHAGEDLVAQLEFMAAEGFTALEDNGMRGRPVADQERIGAALSRLGMRMGVFVAHTINWNEPTLVLPDAATRETFLKEIGESVDIAKRVNANG